MSATIHSSPKSAMAPNRGHRQLGPDFACAQFGLYWRITRRFQGTMRNKRTRAFWMTLLVYGFAGPLVDLLSVTVIGFVVEAWSVIIDRLAAITPHVQSLSCNAYSRHIDLGCFQRPPDPRQFNYHPWFLENPSLSVFGAYAIGLIPALTAGFIICVGRLRDGGAGFGYAVVVGTVIGLLVGVMAIKEIGAAIGLFFVCLIATLVCWLVTERWWRKAEIAALTEADGVG
jgi:hypothetical protein